MYPLRRSSPKENTEKWTEGERGRKIRKDAETIKMYNLSRTELTAHDISLLSKGLTFSPMMQPNTFTLFKELNKFIRDQRYYNIQTSKHTSTSDVTNQASFVTDHDSLDKTDQLALAQLEELYAENFNADLEWLTQHGPTSPPVRYTSLRPKSIFNPTHNKGPYLQTFY